MSWILLLVSALLSLPAVAAEKAASPPNVLLISVDTLRADHLGCYGCGRPASPHVDALAEGFKTPDLGGDKKTADVMSYLKGRVRHKV